MNRSRPAPRAPLAASCALALSLCLHAARAQDLPPVVVVATREPQPLDRVAADVVVVDAERIRDSSADSLEDLLRREAGLQLSRNGGPGQNASVFIRGSAANGTVVLVDGVRVGSATLGQAEFEALDLSQIERIEVLRGPGSSLYGADAVGGVVRIFTRRGGGTPRLAAHAAFGGYGSSAGSLAASGAAGAFDYAASLARERSDGVSALRPNDLFGNFNPDRDGYGRTSGRLELGVTPAAGHRIGASLFESRLNQQYDGSEFAPPDFVQDATADFRNRLATRVASIDYRGQWASQWTTSVQLSRSDDDLTSGGRLIDRFITRREQLTWQGAWKPDANRQLVLAVERLEERARSTSFGGGEVERDDDALVLGYSAGFGRHLLQADWRHDRGSQFGDVNTGRLGWSVELLKGWRARALAGTTFRAPSFNDLYFPGFGIATLRPERGRSLEVGLAWSAGESSASATLYRNRVRDLIGFEPDRSFCPSDPAYDFGCARNIGRARLQGASLAGAHRAGDWRLRGSVELLDAKDDLTGQRLARRAAHQESFAAEREAGAWTFGVAVLDVGARPDAGVVLGAYQTIDLRATRRLAPRWRVEAKLLNAADRRIEPLRDYQGLGRQAWVGLRYDSGGL